MRKIYYITILMLILNIYLCAQTGIRTAFYGGIGFCTNEGSYPMNPGLNLRLESEYKPIRFIGVGCDADYTWFPVRKDTRYVGKYEVGYNYLIFSFVPKVYIPITEKVNISYEFDPGICISRYYSHTDNSDSTKADQLLSLTHGLIFSIYSITAACRFNVAYSTYKIQWVNINIGYEWIARLTH